MTQSIVQTYIERLKKHFRVTSDDDLAHKLEIGKSTIATWRRRGAIPKDVWGEQLVDDVDYFPVIYDHLAKALSGSEMGERILLNAAMNLTFTIDPADIAGWANWIADYKYWIFYKVVQRLTFDQDEMRIDDAYVSNTMVSFAIRVASGNVLTSEMLKEVRSEMRP